MNFRQLMALRPLNDEKMVLQNKSFDEVVEIAALRKVELDQREKEIDKWQEIYYAKLEKMTQLQKKYYELQETYSALKKSSDVYENVSFSLVQELEDKIENLEEENEQFKLSLMTAYIRSK